MIFNIFSLKITGFIVDTFVFTTFIEIEERKEASFRIDIFQKKNKKNNESYVNENQT